MRSPTKTSTRGAAPRRAATGAVAAGVAAALAAATLAGACGQGGDADGAGALGGGEAGVGAGASEAASPAAAGPLDSARALASSPVPGDSAAASGVLAGAAAAETTAADSTAAAAGTAADSLPPGSLPGDTAWLTEPPVLLTVPVGTRVRLTVENDVSTDRYGVGDPVVATVVQHVTAPSGEILIPQGAHFLGRVEASANSGGIGEPAILEVAFETLSAWSYERPIESVVVDAQVTLDPEAERARRAGSRGDRVRPVAGRIAAGSVVVVQLREAVTVPPPDSLAPAADSARDTVAAQGAARRDR